MAPTSFGPPPEFLLTVHVEEQGLVKSLMPDVDAKFQGVIARDFGEVIADHWNELPFCGNSPSELFPMLKPPAMK